MEFDGLGAESNEEDRTGYLLNTAMVEVRAGYRFSRALNAGFDLGYGGAHTGPVTRDDIPSIETKFDATTPPGLFDDTRFFSWGAFANTTRATCHTVPAASTGSNSLAMWRRWR